VAGYFVASYTITNQAAYAEYLSSVGPILEAHGAEALVVDFESEPLEGSPGRVTVVLRFPTKAAVRACYESPEYQAIIHHRTDNVEGLAVIVEGS
jgi:uncharacterized protein (DUF1330 family)